MKWHCASEMRVEHTIHIITVLQNGKRLETVSMQKKKKLAIAGIVLLGASMLSGCGIVDMTEAESRLIAGYAADVLIRYDKSYVERFAEDDDSMKVEPDSIQAEATPTPAPTEQPTEVPTVAPTEIVADDNMMAPEHDKAQVVVQEMSPAKVGEIFGLNGIEITYAGCQNLQSYPVTEADQLAFQVEATNGNKLLVYSFDLTNVLSNPQNCNLIGQNLKFRIRINGTDMLNAQKTLLLDDLSQLNLVLNPREAKRGVIVCQVAGDYNPEITSVELIVRTGGQDYTIPLQ